MTDIENENLDILICAIKAKDKNAFNRLYDKTVNKVYSLAFKITRSEILAEEVVSDVYFQVWQQADKYDDNRHGVIAWLMVLCRSRALDLLRKQTRSSENQEFFAEHNSNQSTNYTDLSESIDTQSAVYNALNQLDSQQQQLLSLAYFKGYTHNELVAVTGLPLGTVKTNLRRSLIKMQQHLESLEA